ncbi:class I SAM-dependent methyltransferase [Salinifilum ghardaiensis]
MISDKTWFDDIYAQHDAPWVLGEAQPEIVRQERAGAIRGSVLDIGCGSGDNTLHLAERGYEVLGVDFSEQAIRRARDNAAARSVRARFEVADALRFDRPNAFDTIVDSALFHVFGGQDRAEYVANLHRLCRPGGRVHVLAAAPPPPDHPGAGADGPPQVTAEELRAAFGAGWEVEELRATELNGIATERTAERFGVPPGQRTGLGGWFARVRRL